MGITRILRPSAVLHGAALVAALACSLASAGEALAQSPGMAPPPGLAAGSAAAGGAVERSAPATRDEGEPDFLRHIREDRWQFTVAPYIWLSTVQGRTSIGDLSANLDVGYDKLFDLLGQGDLFAAMGYFQVQKGPLGAFVDFTGSTVRTEEKFRDVGRNPIKIRSDTLTLYFALYWQLLDLGPPQGPGHVTANLDAGFRWNQVYSKLSTYLDRPDRGVSRDTQQNWIDPVVGTSFNVGLTDRVSAYFRGDIGGFGAGSQLAWELVGVFDIYLGMLGSARTDLLLGYKVYDFDFETSSKNARSVQLQQTLSGPIVGIAWKF